MMKLRFLFFLFLFTIYNSATAQLLEWNTFSNAGTEVSEPSINNDPNISAANLTLGAGVTAAANMNRFGGSNWWDTGDAGTSTIANAVAGNDYIQFIVTPNAGYSFTPTSFVFNWDSSGTGPKSVALRSSVDGFSSNIGSLTAAAIGIANTITISGITNSTSAITFRIYGFGDTAAGGTGGFDVSINAVNVTLNGTTALSLTGIVTAQNGDWFTGSTWVGGVVPTSSQNAIVNHAVTASAPIVRNAGTTTTINAGKSLIVSNSYANNGTTNIDGIFVTSTGGGVQIGGGGLFKVNGSVRIDAGGFFSNAPVYGASSTLVYNTGGTYGRGFEWSSLGTGTIGTTPGYPNNVQISGNTTINYINGAAGSVLAKAIAGNLAIDAGSNLYMDYGSVSAGGALTVGGDVAVAGNFSLGFAAGDDLKMGGNLSVTGAGNLIGNNRAIFFTKNGTQTISSTSALTIPYVVLAPTTGNTTVKLLSNLTISAPLAGNVVSFSSGADVFDINGNTLTIGTSGIANVISGSGTFKGSTTSNLALLGSGSIGTVNFTAGFQNLGTLTMNRSAGSIGCVMGTPVTINSGLVLTNGLLDLGANTMTLASAVPAAVAGSANSFIIADDAAGGILLRNISTTGVDYEFPIGDKTGTIEYSPAKVKFTAGTFSAAYFGVSVNDSKEPNMDAAANYLTRYWSVNSSGTFNSPAYSFTGTYLNIDVVGVNLLSNQWNGSAWTNNGAPIGGNTLSLPATTLPAVNHFTAGYRDPEINVYVGSVATSYITGSTYDFGTQLIGTNTPVTFTIQNTGQQGLNLTSATFSGAPAYVYTTAYTNGSLSGPSGTRTFTVTFSPVTAGPFSGSISIPNNDPTGAEAPYIINFTGVGMVPAPEINVKGFTGATGTIVDGSATPVFSNNTLFSATAIGSSSTKDFEIQNTGAAVLTLTGAPLVSISGTNAADFSVTTAPATSTIAAAASTTFIITFTPQAAGVRTAIVTIANNDTDENPYDYVIQGTGNCAAATNTITPASGPVNTEVTVTASANNLTGAIVTFNGVAAVVTPVSSTEIKVWVPAGATSGALVTTNAQGCSATNYFTVINNSLTSCQGNSGTPRNKIFISEVTDHGSGSHSYVEIWNATGATVNLLNYSLRIYNNGNAAPTATITLPSYSLANNSGYVVAFGGTDATSNPGGYVPNLTNAASGINDNDNIRLFNNSGTWIDLWGDTSGTPFTIAPSGYYYRRKNTGITAPSTTWNPSDWNAGAPVDYSDVGLYDFSQGIPPNITAQPSFTPSCKAVALTVSGTEGFVGGNPLAYQWYSAAPGATTWTQLANGGVYSGVTSATLNISNIAGLDDYQYYCQVRENGATCYTASNAVKIDEALTVTWNGSGWSPSAPTSSNIAVINGNYNTAINGNIDACSVTVNSGFTLSIAANNYVAIQNDLTVSNTATLFVADDASLVMIDDAGIVTNNGTMKVEKTTSAYNRFDYTYWSSPVVAATIGGTFPTWRLDYAFQFATANYADVVAPFDGFDDDNNAWVNVPAATAMTKGKGYAVMAPTTGTFPTTSTVVFTGAVNNGVVSIPLALSGNGASNSDDFNLVGNPYPSAIFANDFINANANFSGTLYFWTHRTGISSSNPGPDSNNFITVDYAMYNLSGGTSSGTGSPTPTGYVASGEGFFIDAQSATNLVFNNSMRNKLYNNSQFYRTPQHIEGEAPPRDRIWLNMENEQGLFSQQLIGYFPEATAAFDRGYDGVVNQTENSISFYSFIENDKYRIQGKSSFDPFDIVPLGYNANIAGTFKIRIDNSEGNLATTSVYLEDKQLGVVHDLKQAPYLFTTAAGTFNDRFVLRYTDNALGQAENSSLTNDVIAYVSGGQIIIRSASEPLHSVVVSDVVGRTVFQANTIGSAEYSITNLRSSDQPLILRILTQSGKVFTRKVIF
ncbi:MAG: choice-of-anchor D domain-containing protein [Flavobacterium sp.]|nr:MAG: choice-of-anchor D domain-containing protein [Flavobacterium sp.]